MKKQIFSLVLTALVISCASASGPSAEGNWMSNTGTDAQENEMNRANNAPEFSNIEGNEWKLIEVYVDGRDSRFSRNTLPEDLRNFFTLKFDGGTVSGVGAPNLYSAPYTTGDNQISIMLMRSTMMASFFQPENLTEHEYFTYMQNTHEWKLVNNNLELLSKTENGSEVRLVFSL